MATVTQAGFLVFPGAALLDITLPYAALAAAVRRHLVWKTTASVETAEGMVLIPDKTLIGCPDLALLVVPGGPGVASVLADAGLLGMVRDFLDRMARAARRVVAVGDGAGLLMPAAGPVICAASGAEAAALLTEAMG